MKTSLIYKISLAASGLIMAFYFGLQSLVVFEYLKYTEVIGILGYACFLGFVPFFLVVVIEFLKRGKEVLRRNLYLNKLVYFLDSFSTSYLLPPFYRIIYFLRILQSKYFDWNNKNHYFF